MEMVNSINRSLEMDTLLCSWALAVWITVCLSTGLDSF